jgi:hypothetical protein
VGQIRCTQFFTDNKYGWSETIWSAADTPELAMTQFIKLAFLRYRLLGTGPQSTYLRTSDDKILRDADIQLIDFTKVRFGLDKLDPDFRVAPQVVPPRALATPSDVPYSAILIRMSAGTKSHRMCYMRGAPDEVIVDPAGPLKPQAWATAFSDYKAQLESGQWYFLGVQRDPALNPPKQVTGMAGVLPNIVFTVPAHGFQSGDFVHADQFKGLLMPRGNYTVKTLTADTLQLLEYTSAGYLYLRGGRLQLNNQTLKNITEVIIRGETHRDTGGPFDRSAGRRKKKAIPH